MLQNIIDKKLYAFHDKIDSWENAIKFACQPLLEAGIIEPEYSQYIIDNVHEFGPYIVIAPDICIPHAQEGKGVNDTAIGFMNVKQPVDFGDQVEYKPRLFFVLASTDSQKHLENLSQLVEMVEDEELLQALIDAREVSDLQKLI